MTRLSPSAGIRCSTTKSLSRQKKTWTLPHIIWGYDSCAAHGSAYPRTKRSSAWIPNKRPDDMVRITTPELAQAFIDEQVAAVREQIGDKKVLLALSGGVDSLRRRSAAHQGHRQAAHLRAREPRPHAQGRKPSRSSTYSRTSWTRTWSTWMPPTASWASSSSVERARGQAQDHRRRVHPCVRGGGPQGRQRGRASWRRAPSTPTSWSPRTA